MSCVCELGLSCINQPTSSHCFSRRSSVRQGSIVGPLHQSAIDRSEFNLNHDGRLRSRRGGSRFDTERHDPPGSAVGKDSDEALHRTIQISRSQGSNLQRSIRKQATLLAQHVLLQFHAIAYLCPVSVSLGLGCINQPTSFYCCSRLASASQGSIIGLLHQSAIDRPEFNLNQVILARDAKRAFAKTTEWPPMLEFRLI